MISRALPDVFVAQCSFDAALLYLSETLMMGYYPETPQESVDMQSQITEAFTKLVKLVLHQFDFRLVVEEFEEHLIAAVGDHSEYDRLVGVGKLSSQQITERFTCLVFNEYQARVGNAERIERLEILSNVGSIFTMKVFTASH